MKTDDELIIEVVEDLKKNRFEFEPPYGCVGPSVYDRRDNKRYTVEEFVNYANDIEYERLKLIDGFLKSFKEFGYLMMVDEWKVNHDKVRKRM